jgi:eukaryotic-like serine/threonine-protein kinase
MALRTRVWSAGKLLLLGGALLLTYVLFALASMRVALRTRDVTVPTLVGRTVNDAQATVTQTGLNLRVEEGRRPDPKIPAGQVLAQDPQPGTNTRRERSVKVWLSAGPRATIVPLLIGESERTAQLRLQQDGLEVAAISEVRTGEYPSDAIIAQTPAAKSNAARVALLVNRGERGATYVMPDLIGVNGDRAADVLRSHAFRVAVVGDHPYPGVPAGIVLRQNPQAGFQIAPGEPISLEVSR